MPLVFHYTIHKPVSEDISLWLMFHFGRWRKPVQTSACGIVWKRLWPNGRNLMSVPNRGANTTWPLTEPSFVMTASLRPCCPRCIFVWSALWTYLRTSVTIGGKEDGGHKSSSVYMSWLHNFQIKLTVVPTVSVRGQDGAFNTATGCGFERRWGPRDFSLLHSSFFLSSVAYPGIFFGGGGFNKFSWGQRTGIWGR